MGSVIASALVHQLAAVTVCICRNASHDLFNTLGVFLVALAFGLPQLVAYLFEVKVHELECIVLVAHWIAFLVGGSVSLVPD